MYTHVYTRLHGLYQVKLSSYDNCLKDDIDKEWSLPRDDGSLLVWLDSGSTYYFIDPVGDNCLNGVKFKVSICVITWIRIIIINCHILTYNRSVSEVLLLLIGLLETMKISVSWKVMGSSSNGTMMLFHMI